jgi:hypothetical protein
MYRKTEAITKRQLCQTSGCDNRDMTPRIAGCLLVMSMFVCVDNSLRGMWCGIRTLQTSFTASHLKHTYSSSKIIPISICQRISTSSRPSLPSSTHARTSFLPRRPSTSFHPVLTSANSAPRIYVCSARAVVHRISSASTLKTLSYQSLPKSICSPIISVLYLTSYKHQISRDNNHSPRHIHTKHARRCRRREARESRLLPSTSSSSRRNTIVLSSLTALAVPLRSCRTSYSEPARHPAEVQGPLQGQELLHSGHSNNTR